MKVSLKEAYKMATKALPEFKVQVQAVYGSAYSYRSDDKPTIKWEITARKDSGDYINESDEYFSVALARVVAETERQKAKPAEDVEVETDEKVDEVVEEEKQEDSNTF